MTLTQAAVWTKKIITGSAIFIAAALFILLIYNLYQQYQISKQPNPSDIPQNSFGALPAINFPTSNISSSNYSYSLDTETGQLPSAPKIMKVYFIPRTGVTLLAPDKSKALAQKLGFNNGPDTSSSTVYKYDDGNGGTLIMDLTTGNFHYSKNSLDIPDQNPNNKPLTLPDNNTIVSNFKNYLSSADLLPAELNNGRTNVTYTNTNNTDSDQAIVSIWPDNIDKVPIVTANFVHGLVKATVSKYKPGQVSINQVDYIYWPVDKTTSSTYLLKTPDQAYADLRSGASFVAVQPPNPNVSITSVFLAYFEMPDYTPYLQPVYVFQGPNFAAVVPAVNYQSVTNPTPQPTSAK